MQKKYRYVFFGTPDIAAETLTILCTAGLIPELVVTAPATPQGRGMQVQESATAVVAQQYNIPCITPEKITPEVRSIIATYEPDFLLVVAYAKLLPQSLLDSVHGKVLNLHPSLLPLYRGPSPLESVLLSTDNETGVTIMELDAVMDHGPIVAQQTIALPTQTTYQTLTTQSAHVGAALILECIDSYLSGGATPVSQIHDQATHTRKYVKADGDITAITTDEEKWRIFRAFGHRGWVSYTVIHRGVPVRVKVTEATYEDGSFVIQTVIPENKKPMSFAQYEQWLQS